MPDQKFKDSFNSFFSAVQQFKQSCLSEKKLSRSIQEGLNVFNGFPDSIYSCLFLMNPKTFEFEFSAACPPENKEIAAETYSYLVENNAVGLCLQTGNVTVFPLEEEPGKDFYIIVPLLTVNNVLGLVFLKLKSNPEQKPHMVFQLFDMFSGLFSTVIENFRLEEERKKVEDILQQQIASRTMELVVSKKKIMDKFEDLKVNISMSLPHEIRTPINHILGYSDLMIKSFEYLEPEESKEMLTDIHNATQRLYRLLENYLFFTNLSVIATNYSEILELRNKRMVIDKLALESLVFSIAEKHGREKDIDINLEEAELCISEEYFMKLISELTDNSLKYSEPGSKVYIKTMLIDDNYLLSFSDSGRGMTEDQIVNIEAYLQFDRKENEQQGMGLGLPIVRKIARIHDGQFEINSEQGKYTKVNISLPLVRQTIEVE